MCDYCDVKKHNTLWLKPIFSSKDIGLLLDIDQFNGKHYLRRTVYDESGQNQKDFHVAEIKFCPICGRKLDE